MLFTFDNMISDREVPIAHHALYSQQMLPVAKFFLYNTIHIYLPYVERMMTMSSQLVLPHVIEIE